MNSGIVIWSRNKIRWGTSRSSLHLVVANGRVYVVTQSNHLQVYGLLNTACDVNQDGVVDVLDLQLVVDAMFGQQSPTSDINRDGQLNIIDLQMVFDAATGRGCRF